MDIPWSNIIGVALRTRDGDGLTAINQYLLILQRPGNVAAVKYPELDPSYDKSPFRTVRHAM